MWKLKIHQHMLYKYRFLSHICVDIRSIYTHCLQKTVSSYDSYLNLSRDQNKSFFFWLDCTKFKTEITTISSSQTTMLFQLGLVKALWITANLAPDSPHLLCHTPQWLPGHLCSTWEPDCGSAPDQLCPRFQTWLLCRPNIPSESEKQLRGHKADKPMTMRPVATELHEMCFCEGDNLRPMLETHTQEDYLLDSVHIFTFWKMKPR